MTILFKTGNILDVREGIIVHGCNLKGVMGSGLALQIKNKYLDCYRLYRSQVYLKALGETIWYPASERLWIVNALTQETYGKDPNCVYVSYRAIHKCFDYILKYAAAGDYSVHVPDMIDAGLGGGDRAKILSIIADYARYNNFMNDLTFWK